MGSLLCDCIVCNLEESVQCLIYYNLQDLREAKFLKFLANLLFFFDLSVLDIYITRLTAEHIIS